MSVKRSIFCFNLNIFDTASVLQSTSNTINPPANTVRYLELYLDEKKKQTKPHICLKRSEVNRTCKQLLRVLNTHSRLPVFVELSSQPGHMK